jgi:hypothetical protein
MEPLEKLKVEQNNKDKPQVAPGNPCAEVKSKTLLPNNVPADRGDCEKLSSSQGGEFK